MTIYKGRESRTRKMKKLNDDEISPERNGESTRVVSAISTPLVRQQSHTRLTSLSTSMPSGWAKITRFCFDNELSCVYVRHTLCVPFERHRRRRRQWWPMAGVCETRPKFSRHTFDAVVNYSRASADRDLPGG